MHAKRVCCAAAELTAAGHAMPVRCVRFSSDSSLLFTASDDKHINVCDVAAAANVVASVAGHGSWVLSVDCSLDGQFFASG